VSGLPALEVFAARHGANRLEYGAPDPLDLGNEDTNLIAAADFDGDGRVDILSINALGTAATIHFIRENHPAIVSLNPPDHATVTGRPQLTALFDQRMDQADGNSLPVFSNLRGQIDGSYHQPHAFTLQFVPSEPLRPGETLTLVATDRASMWGDVTVADPGVWTLYVQSATAPAVFSPASDVGGAATVAVAGDFNGNGRIDLCIGGGTAVPTRIFWNQGSGHFSTGPTLSTGRDTRALVAADLTGSGRLDIIEGNFNQQSNVYLNSGSGFGSAQAFGSAEATVALAVGDLDGDGRMDVATAVQGGQDRIFYGDGLGGFSAPVALGAANGNSRAVAIATAVTAGVNQPLILIGDHGGQNIAWVPDGEVYVPLNFGTGADNTIALAVADFDGDGLPDVVIGNENAAATLSLGGPTGFGTPTAIGSALTTHSILVADLDGDGNLDIVLVRGAQDATEVLLGNGQGGFGAPVAIAAGLDSRSAVAADFDNTGQIDLFLTDSADSQVWANGELALEVVSTLPGQYAAGNPPWTVTFQTELDPTAVSYIEVYSDHSGVVPGTATVNGATLEFTPASYRAGELYILRLMPGLPALNGAQLPRPWIWRIRAETAAAAPQFVDYVDAGGTDTWKSAVPADMNANGLLDIVATRGTELVILEHGSSMQFTEGTPFGTPQGVFTDVFVADMNRSGRMDIVANDEGYGAVLLTQQSNGTFVQSVLLAAGKVRGIADLDGDGYPDVVYSSGIERGEILWNNSGTFVSSGHIGGVDIIAESVRFGTRLGDGRVDLFWGHALFRNLGNRQFERVSLTTSMAAPVLWDDLTGNGIPEVVVGNRVHEILDGYNNSQRTTISQASGLCIGAADLNGDGRVDLLYRTSQHDFIWHLNQGALSFSSIAPIQFLSGFEGPVFLADFDGDGRVDILTSQDGGTIRVVTQQGAPAVVKVTPPNESVAGPGATLDVEFSEAMDPTTLDGNIIATSNQRGRLSGVTAPQQGNTEARFTPAGGLRAGEVVHMRVSDGVANPASESMRAPYEWRVYVGSQPALADFDTESELYAANDSSRRVVAADFNGNGHTDLLVSSHLEQDYIYWNDGTGAFPTRSAFGPAGSAWAEMATGDLNGNGLVDVVLSRNGTGLEVYHNQGSGVFSPSTLALTGAVPVLADIFGDGYIDILTSAGYVRGGASGFGPVESWPTELGSPSFRAVGAADLNNDGQVEVVLISGPPYSRMNILAYRGGRIVQWPHANIQVWEPRQIQFADVTGNGFADAILTQTGNYSPRVARNLGDMDFATNIGGISASGSHTATVADFNGNGHADLLFSGEQARLMLNDGSGNFSIDKSFPLSVGAATAADLSGNACIDIVGLRSGSPDGVWFNYPQQSFPDATIVRIGTPVEMLDSIDAAADFTEVFSFRVTDEDLLDLNPVGITELRFRVQGFPQAGDHEWRLGIGQDAPLDSSTVINSSGRVIFSDLTVTIPRGQSLDFTLYVRLAPSTSSVTDGRRLLVSLNASDVDFLTGSIFTGGVDNGDGARYTVIPTRIEWVTRPGFGLPGWPLDVQPVVALTDAAGNRALSATGAVQIDGSTVSPGPVAPVYGTRTAQVVNGEAVFSSLQVDTPGQSYRLRASWDSLTADSEPFDVESGAVPQPPLFTSLRVTDAVNVYRAGDTISLRAQLGRAGLDVRANFSGVDPALGTGVAFTDHGNGTYTLTSAPLEAATMLVGQYLPIVATATNASQFSATRTARVHTLDGTGIADVYLNQPASAVGPGDLRITLLSDTPLQGAPRLTISNLPSSLNTSAAPMTGKAGGQAFHYMLHIPDGSAGIGHISVSDANDAGGSPVSINGISEFTIVPAPSLVAVAEGDAEIHQPQRVSLVASQSVGATSVQWTQVGGPDVTVANTGGWETSVDLIKAGVYAFRVAVTDGGETAHDTVTVVLHNSPPRVDAGRDQYLTNDDVVSDNGKLLTPLALKPGLFDENGDDFEFEWVVVGAPEDGNLRVLDPYQLEARLEVIDAATVTPGVYTLSLIAADRTMQAADQTVADTVRIVITGPGVSAPSAHAGFPVVGLVGMPVELSGHESSDSDAPDPLDPDLDYFWSMERRPPGSTTSIQNDTTKRPSFVPDVPGTYTVSLVVMDPDGLVSGRDYVDIVVNRANPPNSVPRAVLELSFTDTDSNGSLNVGEPAVLSAQNSVDGEDDPISFQWRQVAGPAAVFLPDPAAAYHEVVFAEPGTYRFRVEVRDDTDVGIPAEITVLVAAAGTVAPQAHAVIDPDDDPEQDGYVLMIPGVGVNANPANPSIELDATGSSVDPALGATYRWALVRGPTVSLSNADTPVVSFTPQISRTYKFELTVTDSNGVSTTRIIPVAIDTWHPVHNPSGNAVPRVTGAPDQTVAAEARVTLEGSAENPNDPQAELFYIWVQRSGPPVFLDMAIPDRPTFTAPIAGTYGFTLYVDDGNDISPGFDFVVTAASSSSSGSSSSSDDGGCAASGTPSGAAWVLALLAAAGLFWARRRNGLSAGRVL
jgi:hypothetical protein